MDLVKPNKIDFQYVGHFESLTKTLETFAETSTLTDVTLISGTRKIHIHRHMLFSFTSYFSEFLTIDASNCYVVINGIKETILEKVVELIYNGRVSIHKSITNEFYESMDLLKLNNFPDLTAKSIGNMVLLTCTGHKDIVLNNLLSSRTVSQSDVIFVTNDFTQVSVHSYIISTKSKNLLNIFLKHSGRKKPFIFVLQNVTKEHLESVVEFCYKGFTCIAQEDLQSVYEAANLLGVEQLCEKILHVDPHVHRATEKTDGIQEEVISRIKTFHCVNLDQTNLYKKRLSNILECEHLVDVSLIVNRHTFNTHGIVLSEFSPYFRHLSKNLTTMRDSFVFIKDLSSKDIESFIEYIYTGETEFLGRPSDFCSVMKDWIDFDLLPICESKECQILSKVCTTMTDKTENMLRDSLKTPSQLIDPIKSEEFGVKADQLSEPSEMHLLEDFGNSTKLEAQDRVLQPEQRKSETEDTLDDVFCEEGEEEAELGVPSRIEAARTCQSCGKKFETRQQLRKHLSLHPDAKIMKCRYCGKGFDKRSQLTLHVRTHTGSRPFQCNLCGRGFAAKSALVKHGQTHNKDGMKLFVCAACNKSFARKEYLEEHIRTHTGDKPFECEVCHKKFVGRTGLNHHKKVHDEDRGVVCEVCGKSFTRHALWTHKKTHEKVHECTICHKNFATITVLKLHVSGTHLGHRRHQCEVCGKGFMQKNHLVRHMKLHGEGQTGNSFSCNKCSRMFPTELKLGSHVRKEHSEPGERLYSCTICHKKFAGRSTAIYHRRGHTGERPHACETCGKTFVRPDALSQHIQTHTTKCCYECVICKKKCTSKSALNKHIINCHPVSQREAEINEVKTCYCAICNEAFQSDTQLCAHSILHHTLKKYHCGICDKAFRCQESLTKHATTHSSASPTTNDLPGIYSFQVCEQTYSQVIHNYSSDTIAQNSEGQSENHQQFGVSVLSNANTCLIPETPVPGVRRPFSITIDGNLCCNSDADKHILMSEKEINETPLITHPEIVVHKLQPHILTLSSRNNDEAGPSLTIIGGAVVDTITSEHNNIAGNIVHFNSGPS